MHDRLAGIGGAKEVSVVTKSIKTSNQFKMPRGEGVVGISH